MEALIQFLRRISTFVVFLLLEIIAFLMIINQGTFQNSIFHNATTNVASVFYTQISNITDYFSLNRENKNLAEKNAELQRKVSSLEDFITRKNYESTLYEDTILKIIPAKVVNHTIDKINNYLIINKGAKDGVTENMGVITAEGVVGIIKSVSENYSVVISILSSTLKISGKLKKTDHLCSVYWDGISPYRGRASNIPEHIPTAVGDTIVTSGYSSIFPENIMIGTVKEVSLNPSTAWNDLDIEYATNFMSIRYVGVIVNSHFEELFNLEKSLEQ